MKTESPFLFFNKLKNDRFSLAYMGTFDDELTGTLMRTNETSIHEPKQLKKRLSFLIAECFQNILRHEDKPEITTQTNNKPKIFILRNRKNSHYISSSNLISNTKKEHLESKLKSINTLSTENLRSVYLGALTNNEISDKGGGGLGLIEMARKSGSPLEFSFEFVNYYLSLFFMQVRFATLDKNDMSDYIPIDDTKELYHLMSDENILMVRKGDFSQESILPLINLIENNLNLQPTFTGSKKTIMYLFVELLQNISKHGLKTDDEAQGIIMVSKTEKGYRLAAGNYIDPDKVDKLRTKLESVPELNPGQLTELYKSTLLSKDENENGNAGIGLIEMCKYSTEKIRFSFHKIDDSVSFFSLSVTV